MVGDDISLKETDVGEAELNKLSEIGGCCDGKAPQSGNM